MKSGVLAALAVLMSHAASASSANAIFVFGLPALGANPNGGLIKDAAGALYGVTRFGDAANTLPVIYKLVPPGSGQSAWTEQVLYEPSQQNRGGVEPQNGLVMAPNGTVFGTTFEGGKGCFEIGCGVVFMVTPPSSPSGSWSGSTIYRFDQAHGYNPHQLLLAPNGILYGAADAGGGTAACKPVGGCGVVFSLTPPSTQGGKWTYTVLHRFKGGVEGAQPNTGLTLDAAGTLYGATAAGGDVGCILSAQPAGCGTVFKLSPPAPGQADWQLATLYSFQAGSDGAFPSSALLPDGSGGFYGMTGAGGGATYCGTGTKASYGCGTFYHLSPGTPWTESVLYVFLGDADAAAPGSSLLADAAGNMYATSAEGGGSVECNFGCGTVFKLNKPQRGRAWSNTILHVANGTLTGNDAFPIGGLVGDQAGNIYAAEAGNYLTGGGGELLQITP